jgi:hypothetical protein
MRATVRAAPPSFHPRRDERFHGQYHFEFPPHVVYNMPEASADERNLALLCKRTLEMDVPEMMASFMTERDDQPWEFHHDYARQLWDEARHAMMGSVALEARGVDWKGEIPLNVSFALRLNLHATPVERQIMLFAIEQSLMPGETGKRYEYETAVAAGDALSAHVHDYDWADEVLHTQIGRRALARGDHARGGSCASARSARKDLGRARAVPRSRRADRLVADVRAGHARPGERHHPGGAARPEHLRRVRRALTRSAVRGRSTTGDPR